MKAWKVSFRGPRSLFGWVEAFSWHLYLSSWWFLHCLLACITYDHPSVFYTHGPSELHTTKPYPCTLTMSFLRAGSLSHATGVLQGFGDQFIHSGSATSTLPEYVDPYDLLNEATVDPYYPIN